MLDIIVPTASSTEVAAEIIRSAHPLALQLRNSDPGEAQRAQHALVAALADGNPEWSAHCRELIVGGAVANANNKRTHRSLKVIAFGAVSLYWFSNPFAAVLAWGVIVGGVTSIFRAV